MKVSTALISVFDKTGVVEFARALHEAGVTILSTGGTAKKIREAGIPIREVSEHTGHPEIMDGRVKTLHPKIHGGILAVRDNEDHIGQAKDNGITLIDLVAVNLYPFQKVVAKPSVTLEEAIENIDIGGPTMVRSAAKNCMYVTIVTDPGDYGRVVEDLKTHGGESGIELRKELAVKAFAHTAEYDSAINSFLSGGGPFPDVLTTTYRKLQDLRYGENPHQKGAYYRALKTSGASVASAVFHGGKELSYNNILDLEAAFELVREFEAPSCVVVKHNNPCGAAQAETPAEAFRGAKEGDPVSAFGGIVAFNSRVDLAAAKAMAEKGNFFEAVIAPHFDAEAMEHLRTKPKWRKNIRILEAQGDLGGDSPRVHRGIRDGLLVQTADDRDFQELVSVSGKPTVEQHDELLFAMTVCKHVRSNAIVITRNRRVAGVGAGQMSRLDSADIAVKKAGDKAKDAVAASDAFFPFPDALETLARAGVKAVIHPGGSVKDEEVAAAAKKHGVVLVTSGMRHFRH